MSETDRVPLSGTPPPGRLVGDCAELLPNKLRPHALPGLSAKLRLIGQLLEDFAGGRPSARPSATSLALGTGGLGLSP